jgi:hypothetical protein
MTLNVLYEKFKHLDELLSTAYDPISLCRKELWEAIKDHKDDVEKAARIVDEYLKAYPPDIFIEPPLGQHGQTMDACSAAALRKILPNIATDIRKLEKDA